MWNSTLFYAWLHLLCKTPTKQDQLLTLRKEGRPPTPPELAHKQGNGKRSDAASSQIIFFEAKVHEADRADKNGSNSLPDVVKQVCPRADEGACTSRHLRTIDERFCEFCETKLRN